MTTLTPAPSDEAVTAAAIRAEFVTALGDIASFYARCPDAPLPGGMVLNIRVPGETWRQKEAALYRIAAALGVQVTERDGVLYAQRRFGPVVIEAHLSPQDRTLADYYARIGRAA